MDGWMDECVDRWRDGWTDGRMGGWMNGWMDELVDGWVDGGWVKVHVSLAFRGKTESSQRAGRELSVLARSNPPLLGFLPLCKPPPLRVSGT